MVTSTRTLTPLATATNFYSRTPSQAVVIAKPRTHVSHLSVDVNCGVARTSSPGPNTLHRPHWQPTVCVLLGK